MEALNMTIFQIGAVCFALWMCYVVSIHAKKKTLSAIEASFWLSTWGGFIVIALFPQLLQEMVNVLHFNRVFDLLVVVALMILSVLVFVSYFGHREAAVKLTKLVQELSLKEGGYAPPFKQKKRP
jgi:hypothetical protein